MNLTPDDERLILLLVSAFASKLPEPEKSESWELAARIQQHRSTTCNQTGEKMSNEMQKDNHAELMRLVADHTSAVYDCAAHAETTSQFEYDEIVGPRRSAIDSYAKSMADRIAELEGDNSKYINALAECRDAFTAPPANTSLDSLLMDAIGQPESVPAYVKAQIEAVGAGGVSALIAAPTVALPGLHREQLIEIIERNLTAVYHCTRVWDAWNIGTMSEDDFEPAQGSDLATNLADEILASAAPTAQAERPEPSMHLHRFESLGESEPAEHEEQAAFEEWLASSEYDDWLKASQEPAEPVALPVVAWRYRTNDTHTMFITVEPPDDAYDKGTISPLVLLSDALEAIAAKGQA